MPSSRVFAIVVAHNGEPYLSRTIEGISACRHLLTGLITVDAASVDGSAEALVALSPTHALTVAADAGFAEAVGAALYALQADGTEDGDLIWILHDDSAPEPGALAALLSAMENSPSVGVCGPKQVAWDDPRELVEFGITTTRSGRVVRIGSGQLDQSQYDDADDVLAVGTAGMLVRRELVEHLAGFDPRLSFTDDGLDLCVRARLAGARVIRVPDARVRHAEGGGRDDSAVVRGFTARRRAELYRAIVWASGPEAFLRWLLLLPAALLLSLGHVAAKHPQHVPGELWASLATLVSVRRLLLGRRRFARTRTVRRSALTPLLQTRAETRRTRLAEREREISSRMERFGVGALPLWRFWDSRAPWILLAAAACSAVLWFRLLSASAVSGGGAGPLSSDLTVLWRNAVADVVDVSTGITAIPDAFSGVLAILGSLTAWSPSLSLVVLYALALPVASWGGGVAAGRLVGGTRAAVIGAVSWPLAPSLLAALSSGRVGAIVAHLLLPFVVYFTVAGFDRRRMPSQALTAFAAAALLGGFAVACAPVLAPVLTLAWLVTMAVRPRKILFTVWMIVPAAALLAPTAWQDFREGEPLRILSDPGFAVGAAVPSRAELLLGSPGGDPLGLESLASSWGLPSWTGLLVPTGVLIVLALIGVASRRWVVAVGGVLWCSVVIAGAALLGDVGVATADGQVVTVWMGSLLSAGMLGLILAASASTALPGRAMGWVAGVAALALCAVAVPWAYAVVSGQTEVEASNGQTVPALVAADGRGDPDLRILELTRLPGDAVEARLTSVSGLSLDSANTIVNARDAASSSSAAVAQIASELVDTDEVDADDLTALGIRYILYDTSQQDDENGLKNLLSDPTLEHVGSTDFGDLWKVADGTVSTMTADRSVQWWAAGLRGGVVLLFLLLAIPTSRPLRYVARRSDELTQPLEGGDDSDE